MRYRHLLLVPVFLLAIAGCKSHGSTGNNHSPISTEQNRNFFDYDEIDYYVNNYDESKIDVLHDRQSRSLFDSISFGVVLGHIPRNINDQMFISLLQKIGYSQTKIDPTKFKEINELFCEKTSEEYVATLCIYVYRDILIFKKKHKVVGVAKICFGCSANHIVGAKTNADNFGQGGDYNKLAMILNKKIAH